MNCHYEYKMADRKDIVSDSAMGNNRKWRMGFVWVSRVEVEFGGGGVTGS